MTPVYTDNAAAVTLLDQSLGAKTGFYDLSMLYAQDAMKRGKLVLEKVKDKENPADLLTKFVDHQQFSRLFSMLNIKPFDNY